MPVPNDQLEEEEWLFSLYLPFADQKVVQLKTTQKREEMAESTNNAAEELKNATAQPLESMSSVVSTTTTVTNNEDDALFPSPETKSLLDVDDEDFLSGRNTSSIEMQTFTSHASNASCCWKFEGPKGRALRSNILLQLTYRPTWQGIPEFTQGLRRRELAKKLLCGCRSPASSDGGADDPQSIWETYSADDIADTKRTVVTIRGMGQCQAIQVFLKPKYATREYDAEPELERAAIPSYYLNHWSRHRQRMGQGKRNQSWTRFSEAADSATFNVHDTQMSNYITITFAIPFQTETKYDPPLLWKVQLPPPQSDYLGVMLDTITVFDGSVDLKEPTTHAYIHGYQSWSFTGAVWKGQPQPKSALPNMFSRAFNLGGVLPDPPTTLPPAMAANAKQSTGYYTKSSVSSHNPPFYQSDFFTCISTGRGEIMDENGGPALLLGWISQHCQFGIVGADKELEHITMHASHHAQLVAGNGPAETDWAYCQLVSPHHYDEEPMVHFLHAAAAYNQATPLQNGPLLTGWCSWYHYYEHISEVNLRQNFAKLATMKSKVPNNVVVVDDGYMTAWGDWDALKPGKFSDMGIVSRDIQSYGMRPGIWLAPFACDKHSIVARKHPEWIIRNERGRPANSSNCGKFFYGLDATNPAVRKHVFNSIRRAVVDWGFQVLKIDFLYAACLEGNGKYDMSLTRAQAMHLALQTIREAAGPNVFLIGCGCPIGSGIGYVDGMRVSADTGPTWYPALPMPWWDHGTLPALRAMIRNSMTRAPFGHRWWHNDPDCLLLGETTRLSNDEVASAASIVAMTCGMMLLSDDLTKVSTTRMNILTKIFPMTGVSATVLDLHTTINKGLPSILRLWCTDKYNYVQEYRNTPGFRQSIKDFDYNAEATHFGRQASFRFDMLLPHPNERKRSCIHVASGLGTWTVISLSNWQDTEQYLEIPHLAVQPPPTTGWGLEDSGNNSDSNQNYSASAGYHIYSFWSERYAWVSLDEAENVDGRGMTKAEGSSQLGRHLGPHETEIFHIRPVTPGFPQYIGSDIHFSCGHEVLSFVVDPRPIRKLHVQLKKNLNREGHIYVFVPTVDTRHIQVSLAGRSPGQWAVVGNVPSHAAGRSVAPSCIGRVLRIKVEVHGDESEKDGLVEIQY